MSKTKLTLLSGLVLLLAFSYWLYSSGKKEKLPKYQVQKVERGDVTSTVTASGTLSAVTTVKVGSQVSGIISGLHADFNSIVKKGQLLADLDPTTFQAIVDQRRADLERVRVEQRNSRLAYERAKNLLANGFLSQSEYDTAEANVHGAEAAVRQSEAALRQSETNLSYTQIVSPIDGVVVDRQYDIGQTVAASFQAPTLFTIAQDLTRMQVSTNIDEADIGRVILGKEASFSVDAFSERTFQGKISQIRLSPQIVQNVVTYPVLLDVSNPQLELKPGMTANVSIPVETKRNVLKVANAALRFQPDPADMSDGEESAANTRTEAPKRGSVAYLMLENGKLKPVRIKASITDGVFTAVEAAELKEGDSLVTGFATAKAMESTGGMAAPGARRRPR